MATNERAGDRAARRAEWLRRGLGDELRRKRAEVGLSQAIVALAAGVSRSTLSRIEAGTRRRTSIDELAAVGTALGLDLAVRLYPGGDAIRDAAQARKLSRLLEAAVPPIVFRTEVPLPSSTEHPERRAWDGVVTRSGARAAIEVEMRLSDAQATERRLALKRRDDPVDRFLVVFADTRHNRRALDEHPALFSDLKRLRPSDVLRALANGDLPPSGLVLL